MTFANNQTIRSLLLASIFLACLTRSTSNEMLSIRYNNTGNYDPGERHRASGACGVIERVANLMSCDIVSDLGMERFSAWTHTKTCELETCRKELYEKVRTFVDHSASCYALYLFLLRPLWVVPIIEFSLPSTRLLGSLSPSPSRCLCQGDCSTFSLHRFSLLLSLFPFLPSPSFSPSPSLYPALLPFFFFFSFHSLMSLSL